MIPDITIREPPLYHRRHAVPTSFSQLGDVQIAGAITIEGSGQQGAFLKGAASTRALFIVATTRTLPPNNKGLEFTLRIAADKGFWRQQNRTGVDSCAVRRIQNCTRYPELTGTGKEMGSTTNK